MAALGRWELVMPRAIVVQLITEGADAQFGPRWQVGREDSALPNLLTADTSESSIQSVIEHVEHMLRTDVEGGG